jgi:DNA polymerase-3 subunit alpha
LKNFKLNLLPFIIGYKKEIYLEIITNSNNKINYYLPESYKKEMIASLKSSGKSFNSLYKNFSKKSKLNSGVLITDIKAKKIINNIYCPETYKLLNSNYKPIKIKKIEVYGEVKVYDITLKEHHNFVANNIIVHNCIGKKDFENLNQMMPKIIDGYCLKSNKPYEIAKQEVTQFINIIMDSVDYQFGLNHATAYSMIGYTCAMLRYYYPLEFTTAFFNCAVNDDDFDMGGELATYKKITINQIKFRYSKGEYFFDKGTNSIYKGIGSIKHLNNQVGEELYKLKDMNFKTFLDLLCYIKKIKIPIKTNQLEILILLNYFIEFGENAFLLKVYKLFIIWFDKKVINKNKIEFQDLIIIKEYSKETGKQFRDLDWYKILESLISKLNKNEKLGIQEQLTKETMFIGQPITQLNDVAKNLAYIMEVYDKYTPKLKLYYLLNGKIEYIKVSKKEYTQSNIESFKILKINKLTKKPKTIRNSEGNWMQSNELEDWLVDYQII